MVSFCCVTNVVQMHLYLFGDGIRGLEKGLFSVSVQALVLRREKFYLSNNLKAYLGLVKSTISKPFVG